MNVLLCLEHHNNNHEDTWVEANGLASFEPASPASHNGSYFNFVCSICVKHVLFLNKAATTRLCHRAWGRVSHADRCPFNLVI